MEENIFPLPAVAGILEEQMVEARLHTDLHDEVQKQRNVDLQLELTESYTLPLYLVMDPETGEILGRRDGSLTNEEAFAAFLREAAAKKG